MSFIDLIPHLWREDITNGISGIKGLASPRKYINKLVYEKWNVILIRFIFLGLLSSALQVVVFSDSRHTSFSNLKWIKIAIYDFTLSLAILPMYWVLLFISKTPNHWKIIWGFIYPLRFLFLAPAIIFYGLFLSTENYFFAIPRAIAFYSCLLLLVFIVPFSVFRTVKGKLFAFIFMILSMWTTNYLVFVALTNFKNSESSIFEDAMLYDPIGDELDRTTNIRDEPINSIIQSRSIRYAMSVISKTGLHIDTQDGDAFTDKDSASQLQTMWAKERDSFLEEIKSNKELIQNDLNNADFDTTKTMLKLELDTLNHLSEIGQRIDAYIAYPSADNYINLQKSVVETNETIIATEKRKETLYRTRYQLLRHWMILN